MGCCMNHQKDFVMNVPYARNALSLDDNYCALLDLGIGQCFVNRGKVTEIKTKEEKK